MQMDILRRYYSEYQEENPEKFNKELINYKTQEDILYYIDNICSTLEIISNIKYLGSSLESIRNIYKNTKREKEMEIDSSLLQEIIMKFVITKDDESMEVELRQYFPKLIDGQYFYLNGNYYFPVYQLVDEGSYRTKNLLVNKTMVMPITMQDNSVEIVDVEGNVYKVKSITINMFKAKVNFFVYFLANFGYDEMMKFMELDEVIYMIKLDEEEFIEGYMNFKINNSLGFSVDPDYFNESKNHQIIVGTFITLFGARSKFTKIESQEYWLKQLGSNFTKNNSVHQEKGEAIILSFERSLDNITKSVKRIAEEDKKDIYCLCRWIIRNFVELSLLDSMNINNKRLRVYEMMCYPLLLRFSKSIYGLLNKKNPTLKEIKRKCFNINEGYLLKHLIKSEIIRYCNQVNSIDLFSVRLKGTQSGRVCATQLF